MAAEATSAQRKARTQAEAAQREEPNGNREHDFRVHSLIAHSWHSFIFLSVAGVYILWMDVCTI